MLSESARHSLELHQLMVQFPQAEFPVLKNLDLKIEAGESFVIIGPGGQGKTVLLKSIAGLYRPKAGRVVYSGLDLWALPAVDRRRMTSKMAMSFQRSGLFDSLNAIGNLLFPLKEVLAQSDEEAYARATHLLTSVGLSGQEHKFPHEMSGGMQKRLCIARAISMDPELVLYDDPTAGLDPVTSLAILEVILDAQDKSLATVILTTSDFDLALHMAKKRKARIGFLYRGNFLSIETLDSIFESSNPILNQFVMGRSEGPLEQND